jgi:hypothetical protein
MRIQEIENLTLGHVKKKQKGKGQEMVRGREWEAVLKRQGRVRERTRMKKTSNKMDQKNIHIFSYKYC